MQLEALADLVVLTVKSAQAPVLERLAAADAMADIVSALAKTVADIRDRLVVVETKAALPIQPDTELRDRVLALEHKAPPTFEMPAEFMTRLAAVEARPLPTLATLEHVAEKAINLTPLSERIVKLEALFDAKAGETVPILAAVADLSKDVVAVREKVAAVDARGHVPGPPGKDGADGKDGAPGKDGADGKDGLAGLSFEGVYQDGATYEKGQLATWGGSSWHCNETTTSKPGDGSKAWTLMVKRGRDGKDGRDAVTLPVVSVGGR